MSSIQSLTLNYLVRPSNLSENAPLIIMLHGFGSNEQDLFSFAPELPEKYCIISAQAPMPLPDFYGYMWYEINFDKQTKFSNVEQAVASRKKIERFIDEIISEYPVNPEDVTLIGFSQGAILSYATALSHPEKVKQVVAMSGYIDENMLAENYRENDFSKLRIFSSHGTADQVIPVQLHRGSTKLLDSLKINYEYSEYPVGHGVAPDNFRDFKKWLEAGT